MINKNRALSFFKNICKIPSKTKQEKEIIAYLKKILTDLGFKCWEDNTGNATGGNANNLYAYLKGDSSRKSVCFMAHTDSVEHLEKLTIIEDENIIKSDGNSILGADDKAGIAIIVESIKSVLEQNIKHGDIYILFAVQEECGQGTKYLNTENFTPDITFNFDETTPALSFELSGPEEYRNKWTIEKSIEPTLKTKNTWNGTNTSLTAMAKAVSRIEDLLNTQYATENINNQIFVNMGYIQGGFSMYKIPQSCSLHAIVRSMNPQRAQIFTDKMSEIIKEECEKIKGNFEICESNLIYKSFDLENNTEIRDLINKACTSMGKNPIIRKNFDCFDTSALNSLGLNTVTVSTGYENYHQHTEFLHKEIFLETCEFAYQILINA